MLRLSEKVPTWSDQKMHHHGFQAVHVQHGMGGTIKTLSNARAVSLTVETKG